MKLSIISYCYNEKPVVEKLIEGFKGVSKRLQGNYEVEFIFVDDGSTDGTYDKLLKLSKKLPNSIVVKNKVNKGIGGALKKGFSVATGDFVVTFPGEFAFDPDKIPDLLEVLKDDADIVIGSYHHPKGGAEGIPSFRIFTSKACTFLYKIILLKKGVRLYTTSSGFRAYKKEVLDKVKLEADGFLANSEMVVKSALQGFRIKEYPVVLFGREKGTSSKLKLFKVTKNHLKFQLRLFIDVYLKGKYDK